MSAACADTSLGQRRDVGIIADRDRYTQQFPGPIDQRKGMPTFDLMTLEYSPRRGINWPAEADACRCDTMPRREHRCKLGNLFANARRSARNIDIESFQRDELAIPQAHAQLQFRSTDFNAKQHEEEGLKIRDWGVGNRGWGLARE